MPARATRSGRALHDGGVTRVTFEAAPELPELELAQGPARARFRELVVERADRGVRVATPDGRVRVDLVEHALAALAGLGLRSGLRVIVDGPEIPLLDGGALEFTRALRELGLELELGLEPPRLRVARRARFTVGAARYAIAPSARSEVGVAVRTSFPAPVFEGRARWLGDAGDFAARVAPARTFGWLRDYEALREAGRARGVDPRSVLVFDGEGVLGEGALAPGDPRRREPVLHKLLDLVGDLGLYGGPPVGFVAASRPGHAATHAFVREALASGALERDEREERA